MPEVAPIKPVVNEVMPNTAQALTAANATPQEIEMVNQYAYAYQKGLQLRKLPENVGRNEFSKLSEAAQADVKSIFGKNADPYLQDKPSLWGQIESKIKNIAAATISPLGVAAFKLAPTYQKTIYTAGNAIGENLYNNKSLFSPGTWSDAYQGKGIFDPKQIPILTAKYGKATSAVAMGVLQGKTPAQIMQEYSKGGAWDPALGAALTASLDDPKFQNIIDDFKLATFNPGNYAMRGVQNDKEKIDANGQPLLNKPAQGKFAVLAQQFGAAHQGKKYDPKVDYMQVNTQSKMAVSGAINGVYSFMIDPLTWITGGGDKAATLGQRLAASVKQAADEGRLAEGVADAFKNPKVAKLWDKQLGPALNNFAKATNSAEKAKAYEEIKLVAPSMADREIITALTERGTLNGKVLEPVTNAESAQDFFSHVENVNDFLGGSVDGTNFYRNGVAVARNYRLLRQGKYTAFDAFFNKSLATQTAEELAITNAKGKEATKILQTIGQKSENGINPNVVELQKMTEDMGRLQNSAKKLGRAFARSPAGGVILYGPDAAKTINTFTAVARLVLPRDLAKVVAEEYLTSAPNEQLAMVRNLHYAFMQKMGLEGTTKGKEVIKEVLNKTMNAEHGMGSAGVTEIPDHILRVMSKNTVNWDPEFEKAVLGKSGAPQPSQLTNAIAPLDYMKVAHARFWGSDHPFMRAIDGLTQNKFITAYTNAWSFFTLIPRLGIRASADEIFMYIYQQPLRDVIRLITGGARREGKVLTAISGSTDAVGPIKHTFNVLFKKGGPENYVTPSMLTRAVEDAAKELSAKYSTPNKIVTVSVDEVANYLKREAIASRVWDVYFSHLPEAYQSSREAIINAFKHSPHFLDASTNALTARTSMTGLADISENLHAVLFEPSVIDKALKDVGEQASYKGLKSTNKYRNVKEKDLLRNYEEKPAEFLWDPSYDWEIAPKNAKAIYEQKFIALSHLDNFNLRFAYNSMPIADGITKDAGYVFSPVTAFFRNSALKTDQDFARAVKTLQENLGIQFTKDLNDITYVVSNPERLASFNALWGESLRLEQKGLNPVEIARVHIETMLTDMYRTFHGDGSFNQKLLDRIKASYDDTWEKSTKEIPDSKRWQTAVNSIEFSEFEKLTVNKHPVAGGVNTRIEYPGVPGAFDDQSFFKKFGNHAYEAMDRQLNGLFRQPALIITYSRIYKENKTFADMYERRVYAGLRESYPEKISPKREQALQEKARNLADKWNTEVSMGQATATILKYSDNPAIRSNFSISISTVGRFYRANEDYMRRMYRMGKDAPLRTFYRMRLMSTSMHSSGYIYNDSSGNPYIVAPTDGILFAPTAAVMSAFYGPHSGAFKSAQFDELKMKLELINPSFSGDAGEPMLSGPASALAVWSFKMLLEGISKVTPAEGAGVKVSQAINNMALGNIGSNITIRKALIPMALDNLFQMINWDQHAIELNSAGVQAINYLTANGKGLPANATPAQKQDFLNNVKIAAHSILFMRASLGLVSFITPTLQESKGLPGYYKSVGVTGLRPEFFAILDGINKEYPDVQDKYGLATAIFVGKNPGKSIYTASRNNKSYNVLVSANNQMMDWVTGNSDWVNKYGSAAMVFAPQIGKFNANVYNWMASQDMKTLPSIDAYFNTAEVTQAKDQYFGISNKEKADLTGELNLTKRKQIIDAAALDRMLLLASNPTLAESLSVSAAGKKTIEEQTMDNIQSIVVDAKSPISKQDRTMMGAALNVMSGFLSIAKDSEYKALPRYKTVIAEQRTQAEESLQKFVGINPAVASAYNSIFKSILNAYAPEKNVVLSKGN